MGKIHLLIREHGKQHVLDLWRSTPSAVADGRLEVTEDAIERIAGYLGDDENELGFLYSGWCQAALPHKRLEPGAEWSIGPHFHRLSVLPGTRSRADGTREKLSVPFGSKARLIMLYLQTQALVEKTREIPLGDSLRDWCKRMNLSWGGKTIAQVREQAELIARCRFTFEIKQGNAAGLINQNIVDKAFFLDEEEGRGRMFLENAKLSEGFYEQLTRHPVPIQEAAIRQLVGNSAALDVYCWLVYRMNRLGKPTEISWRAMKEQFGQGFRRMDQFKLKFKGTMNRALEVYPEANVKMTDDSVTLSPSDTPVPRRLRLVGT